MHTTGQDKSTVSGRQPFQAPCETVDQIYGHAATDAVKVLGSMVTELDYGIGNVTAALKAAPRGWLMLLTSDNVRILCCAVLPIPDSLSLPPTLSIQLS